MVILSYQFCFLRLLWLFVQTSLSDCVKILKVDD